MIVREAWLTDIYYVSAIMEEMRALGYDRILKIQPRQARKLVADLVCIGIAIDSPFKSYIPFLGKSPEYYKTTTVIAKKLLEIVKNNRGF